MHWLRLRAVLLPQLFCVLDSCWIWSLLIALSVIKTEFVGPGERSWWCEETALDTGHPWWPNGPVVAQAASTDPHLTHTQGLLLHSKKITFIHNKSVSNTCGAWAARVQHFDVRMCGLKFVLNNSPCFS